MEDACPYCGIVLDAPRRSRKCPGCGEKINVRTDRETGEKLYFASDAVARFDAERAAVAARNKVLRRIEWMGFSESDYESKADELAEKWGSRPQPSDVYWTLANEQVMRLGDPRTSGYEIEQVYRQMAQQLHEEGGSYKDLLRRAHEARLTHEWEKIENIEGRYASEWRAEVVGNACCEACEALDGRTYAFEQALQEMPLPPEACTRGWCNCSWANVPPA